MSIYHFIIILVLYSSKVVLSRKVKVSEALRNKQVTVIAEDWVPFLTYDWHRNEMGNYEISNYGGIIWDLLLFMQRARNFTFTIGVPSDGLWGTCNEQSNCTGMLGTVNRREADLALGKYDFIVIYILRDANSSRTFWAQLQ